MVPTARLEFDHGHEPRTHRPSSSAGRHAWISLASRVCSELWSWRRVACRSPYRRAGEPGGRTGRASPLWGGAGVTTATSTSA